MHCFRFFSMLSCKLMLLAMLSGPLHAETIEYEGAFFATCNACSEAEERQLGISVLRASPESSITVYARDYVNRTISKYNVFYVDNPYEPYVVHPAPVPQKIQDDFHKYIDLMDELSTAELKVNIPEEVAGSAEAVVHLESVRNQVIAHIESERIFGQILDGLAYVASAAYFSNVPIIVKVEFADGSTASFEVTELTISSGLQYQYKSGSARDADGVPISSGGGAGGGSIPPGNGGGAGGGGGTEWICAADVEGHDGPACCSGPVCIDAECDATGCFPVTAN